MLIPMLLLTFWLGARQLYSRPLWDDERETLNATFGYWRADPMRTLVEIWQHYSVNDPWNTPGYSFFLNVWGRFVGWSEFTLRVSSLLCGVLGVAWTYRLGRDLVSPAVGIYAAGILGTSGLFVHYLFNLRAYITFALLTPWALWLYFRLIRSKLEPGWTARLGFVGLATVMLYAHYFTGLPLVAIGIYHVLFVKKNRRWWMVLGLFIAAGVLFLPWIGGLQAGIGLAENRTVSAMSVPQILNGFIYVFSNGVPVFLVAALLLALATRDLRVWRIALLALLILATLLLVNLRLSVILAGRIRYLLDLWPLLALLVAVGMLQLRWLAPAALAVWMGVAIVHFSTSPYDMVLDTAVNAYKFPWHRVSLPFRQVTQPGDVLVLSLPDNVGSVDRSNRGLTGFYLPNALVSTTVVESRTPGLAREHPYRAAMNLVTNNHPLRVWIGYATDSEGSDLSELRTMLSYNHYPVCPAGLDLPAAQFELYARSPACCLPADAPPLVRFGEGISLTGADPFPEAVTGALPVVAGWSVADSVPPHTYSVGLHVDDAAGNFVAQADYGLSELVFSCHETAVDVSALRPGEYTVYVVVYAWESGQRLQGEVVATGERGERLPLGKFRIVSNE
jgi:hypothetical protein